MQLSYFVDKASIVKVEPDPLTQISNSISLGIISSPPNNDVSISAEVVLSGEQSDTGGVYPVTK